MTNRPHSLQDREFLRTKSTAELRKIYANTRRSRDELNAYIEAIADVLDERLNDSR